MNNLGIVSRAVLMENGLFEGVGDQYYDSILAGTDNLGDIRQIHKLHKKGALDAIHNYSAPNYASAHLDSELASLKKLGTGSNKGRRKRMAFLRKRTSAPLRKTARRAERAWEHISSHPYAYGTGAALATAGLGYGAYRHYKQKEAEYIEACNLLEAAKRQSFVGRHPVATAAGVGMGGLGAYAGFRGARRAYNTYQKFIPKKGSKATKGMAALRSFGKGFAGTPRSIVNRLGRYGSRAKKYMYGLAGY